MNDHQNQRQFWDEEAATASFSHPVDVGWLKRVVTYDAPILDYGCGYGRTIQDLLDLGFHTVAGLDASPGMLARARLNLGSIPLVLSEGLPNPLADGSFDLVILFAVLTSIPDDHDQRALIEEIFRLLKPGGHLYVSDLPLQTDARRIARYEAAQPPGLPYGTFEIDGGRAVMRHHTWEWFNELFSDFHRVAEKTISVVTMRGRTADTVQCLLQKPRP